MAAQSAFHDESGSHSGDCARSDSRTVHSAVDEHRTPTVNPATYLNPHRPRAPFGIGGPQHGESSGETVTASGRHSRGHSPDSRKRGNENKRVGKFCSITILRSDRVGEPAQFTARSPRTRIPSTITPIDRAASERTMMLARTGRTAGPRLRDVKFINNLELPCGMRSQYARETWSKPCSDHNMHLAFASMTIKSKKRTNISEVISRADDMNPPTNKLFSEMRLCPCRSSEHHDIDIER